MGSRNTVETRGATFQLHGREHIPVQDSVLSSEVKSGNKGDVCCGEIHGRTVGEWASH